MIQIITKRLSKQCFIGKQDHYKNYYSKVYSSFVVNRRVSTMNNLSSSLLLLLLRYSSSSTTTTTTLGKPSSILSSSFRSFATSSQKRKLQQKGIYKSRGSGSSSSNSSRRSQPINSSSSLTKKQVKNVNRRKNKTKKKSFVERMRIPKKDSQQNRTVDWKPIIFLGIFPVVMTGFIAVSREDLREELDEKGIGRLFRDFSAWTKRRRIEISNRNRDGKNESEQKETTTD